MNVSAEKRNREPNGVGTTALNAYSIAAIVKLDESRADKISVEAYYDNSTTA